MQREARYSIGQLVAHRKYGYRGVVAGWDPQCRADDGWYFGNPSQPDRQQAWYHVLVHGANRSTYVAEENLEPYLGGEQVVHPLTKELFVSFSRSRYEPRRGVRFPAPW